MMAQIYFAAVEPLYSLDKQLKGQNFFCVDENTFIVEREKQNSYVLNSHCWNFQTMFNQARAELCQAQFKLGLAKPAIVS